MQRELEPEVMDSPDQAAAYDQMDHAEVNRQFVDDLLAAYGAIDRQVTVVDLGTGTALIPIELCRRDDRFRVVAIDAAQSMLDLARANIEAAGLADRIKLELHDAKQPTTEQYDIVMSNTLVHHLPEPKVFFARARDLAAAGGLLFVRDLFRPTTEDTWQRLVNTYAAGAQPDQRRMLAESLRAALTVDEVRQLVADEGFDAETVAATSDRHWTWSARRGNA